MSVKHSGENAVRWYWGSLAHPIRLWRSHTTAHEASKKLIMKTFLQIPTLILLSLVLGLGILAVLWTWDFGPDNYDTMRGPPFMEKWPPYVPGTEGQKEVKIQVLNAKTLEPIESAIVVGGYYGPGVSGGKTCVHSESAISDAEGWATLPNDQDPRVGGGGRKFSDLRGPRLESAYKRGYQLVRPLRYATAEGHRKWYVRETTPVPYYRPGLVDEYRAAPIREFYKNHKAALLETKERSRIYLMPSTAKTKEERWGELHHINYAGGCYPTSLGFTKSQGSLEITMAVYQELQELGFSETELKSYRADLKNNWEQPSLQGK